MGAHGVTSALSATLPGLVDVYAAVQQAISYPLVDDLVAMPNQSQKSNHKPRSRQARPKKYSKT